MSLDLLILAVVTLSTALDFKILRQQRQIFKIYDAMQKTEKERYQIAQKQLATLKMQNEILENISKRPYAENLMRRGAFRSENLN